MKGVMLVNIIPLENIVWRESLLVDILLVLLVMLLLSPQLLDFALGFDSA
jgi:hypothetical protein